MDSGWKDVKIIGCYIWIKSKGARCDAFLMEKIQEKFKF